MTTNTSDANQQHIADLLDRAAKYLPSNVSEAMKVYGEVLAIDPVNLIAHNAREKHLSPDRYGLWMRINCVIDPRDDIFHFFTRHPIARNPVREYLSDGWRTLSELMLLMEQAGASLTDMKQVLEFAAGYGRFTRHLVKAIPGRVTCADVLPGTVEFVRDEFGVEAFYSNHDPAEIAYPRQYDLVFVLSLFTHLPVRMWAPWLQSLARAVRPGGLLVVSVHNEAVAPYLGVTFGDDGTYFVASSESPSIDGEVYGTTFTTREFVENSVMTALGKSPTVYRPYAFWGGQDGVAIRV